MATTPNPKHPLCLKLPRCRDESHGGWSILWTFAKRWIRMRTAFALAGWSLLLGTSAMGVWNEIGVTITGLRRRYFIQETLLQAGWWSLLTWAGLTLIATELTPVPFR